MRENSIVTRIIVSLMLFAITIIVISNISSASARVYIKILWNITVIFLCFATISFLSNKRSYAKYLIIAALCISTIAIVLQTNMISFCGDGVCSGNECQANCKDCSADLCKNRVCDLPMENCKNSEDCRCPHGYACAPYTNGSDQKGCRVISCGDGFCDLSEGTNNCCDDCGCPAEHICKQHSCYFIPPQVTLNTKVFSRRISATTLAANTHLTNDSGVSLPYVGMLLESTGYLRDTTFTFLVGDYINDTMNISDVWPNDQIPVLWYIPDDINRTKLLLTADDVSTNLTVVMKFKDVTGENHMQTWNFPITITSRNSLDDDRGIVMFVTRDYIPEEATPRGIWQELQKKVIPVPSNKSNTVLFSSQTLTRGYGSRSDIAVLLASAYDARNLSPAIIHSPNGFYVRIRDDNKFVVLDPLKLDSSFDDAIIAPAGSTLYDINQERLEKNYTVISLNNSYIPGIMVSKNSYISADCVCEGSCWTHAIATHNITNNGLVKTSVCATSRIYDIQALNRSLDDKTQCYLLAPNQTVVFNHGWRNEAGCINVTASLRIENN